MAPLTLSDIVDYALVNCRYSAYLQIIAGNEETFRFQIEQIANYEREIQILRRNISALEQEKLKNRELISKLEEALANARNVSTVFYYRPIIICRRYLALSQRNLTVFPFLDRLK